MAHQSSVLSQGLTDECLSARSTSRLNWLPATAPKDVKTANCFETAQTIYRLPNLSYPNPETRCRRTVAFAGSFGPTRVPLQPSDAMAAWRPGRVELRVSYNECFRFFRYIPLSLSLSLSLSIYIYVHICSCICMCIYIYMYTYICIHKKRRNASVYVCIYACMHGWMDGWMDVCTCVVCLYMLRFDMFPCKVAEKLLMMKQYRLELSRWSTS